MKENEANRAGQPEWDPEADLSQRVETALTELVQAGKVEEGQIVVIGTSTSEVIGRHIGTAGSEEAAAAIFEGVQRVRGRIGFFPAFQCCEHLNRALVVEKELLSRYPLLEPVSVIPVPRAGGSMAAYAFRKLKQPVVVETIRAHAGIDIGGTLIGMHLIPVAVPLRSSVRMIGEAPVSMAYTRPKLIGGARAVYVVETVTDAGTCD
ncbi:TIGR01440 family protein [Paenibacillus aurantius]|uniref:TIGR01440 family protein n=1 Tax=Paenibacillus aurantius TaxID=2918900 RepID=UPI00387F7249